MMLLTAFMSCPVPTAPQWTMNSPTISRYGFARAKSASLPPNIIVSVPFSARKGIPEIGQSA